MKYIDRKLDLTERTKKGLLKLQSINIYCKKKGTETLRERVDNLTLVISPDNTQSIFTIMRIMNPRDDFELREGGTKGQTIPSYLISHLFSTNNPSPILQYISRDLRNFVVGVHYSDSNLCVTSASDLGFEKNTRRQNDLCLCESMIEFMRRKTLYILPYLSCMYRKNIPHSTRS